jgi:hypothetical protein
MRRFLCVVVLFCCSSVLFAQESVTNTEYVEVQIVPSQTFTLENIEALPLAPGSKIEYLDSGAVRMQISAELAEQLANDGVQIRILREFILVEPLLGLNSSQSASEIAYEYAEQGNNVSLSPSGWKYSYVDYRGFPYSYTVTSVDVHYQVYVSGIVELDLTNESGSREYSLEEDLYSSVNRTKTGISIFNGEFLAQAWVLWGIDYYGYSSYIDYWWIKLYYDSGINYCSALAYRTDYEYISRVTVGSIDNSTGSSGYTNYTSLSTSMNIGTSYPITVTNGHPDEYDQCGLWIDWNHDNDFDDTGETITTAGAPTGPYTALITPPAGAVVGNTTMRVRIVDTENYTLAPCGSVTYGETEDYTINVAALLKYSGGSGTEFDPYLIATPQDMNAIGTHSEDWKSNFKMIADIDLSAYTGTKFKIIGTAFNPFLGVFDGNNHTISNFTYTTTNSGYAALFAYVGREQPVPGPGVIDLQPVIRSVWLDSPKIKAVNGATLIGSLIRGSCEYCFSSMVDVNCTENAAGLILNIYEPNNINYCHANGTVKGGVYVGGLVASLTGEIDNSEFGGIVRGNNHVGGLLGHSSGGVLSSCKTSAFVTANEDVGGLAGSSGWGLIENCYSRGSVFGNSRTGGLVGDLYECDVMNSYAACTIENVGGGLAGRQDGCTFTSSYWDIDVSDKSSSAGGTGRSTTDMHSKNNYVGWDFTDIWRICDGTNYPKFINGSILTYDFTCPDGVDFIDFSIFAKQWMLRKLSYDIAPSSNTYLPGVDGDGIVNFLDFAKFAENWQGDYNQLYEFANQWLRKGMYNADMASIPSSDGIVDIKDLAIFAGNWLAEI